MINFRANYLNSTTIKHFNGRDYSDCKASIVELSPNSCYDLSTVKNISQNWGMGGTLATDIYACMHTENPYPGDRHYFALTRQNHQYENLRPEYILGIAQVLSDKFVELEYLQVDPENNSDMYFREFKNVGSAILNSIKKMFPQKWITLDSVPSAYDFYIVNGFKQVGNSGKFVFSNKNETLSFKTLLQQFIHF